MARSVEGNKKYKYLDEPDCSLKCFVCSEVADSPYQHGECGELFCKKCIDNDESRSSCPNCRMENPKYNEDKRSMREIKALRVKCKFNDKKCDWVGTVDTLEKHVSVCRLTELPCPNGCKDNDIVRQIKRKDLNEHLQRHCPKRDYECEYCGEKGTYVTITQDHDNTCEKKIVPCTNEECNMRMERMKIKNHLAEECEHTLISCEYTSRCDLKMKRKDMRAHEQDDKAHLLMLNNIVDQLEGNIVKFQNMSVKWRRYFISAVIIFSILIFLLLGKIQSFQGKMDHTLASLKEKGEDNSVAIDEKIQSLQEKMESITRTIASLKEKGEDNSVAIDEKTQSLQEKLESINHTIASLKEKGEDNSVAIDEKTQSLQESINHTIASLKEKGEDNSVAIEEKTQSLIEKVLFTNNTLVSLEKEYDVRAFTMDAAMRFLQDDVHGDVKISIDGATVLTFKLKDYSVLKKNNLNMCMYTPYYSNTYNFFIEVYANGDGSGKGSHVSVYFSLISDSDTELIFAEEVTITLFNQLEDKNHYSEVDYFTQKTTSLLNIPHSKLSLDSASNTQYLKDDILYFRISVKISDPKP